MPVDTVVCTVTAVAEGHRISISRRCRLGRGTSNNTSLSSYPSNSEILSGDLIKNIKADARNPEIHTRNPRVVIDMHNVLSSYDIEDGSAYLLGYGESRYIAI